MSTIPAVCAALKSLLEAALTDVQVIEGSPVGPTTLGAKVVIINRVQGTRSAGSQNRIRTTTRNIPFGSAQDEYTVEMVISVSLPGAGETTAVMTVGDSIFEIARDAIEAAAPDLDVDGVFEALPTGDFAFEPEADSNGRYVTITFGVDVTARD